MRILYYIVLIPLSYLPLSVLYRLSDVLYWIIRRILPYRSSVVRDNMRRAFPEWDDEEVDRQMNRFYHYFSDLIIEGLKSFTISASTIEQRMEINQPEWLKEMAEREQSVILTSGHYGNWEWYALSCTLSHDHQPVGVYLPLSNKYFDKKFNQSRARFGLELVNTKEFKEHIKQSDDHPYIYMMLTDQSPTNAKRAIWTRFLGLETAVQYGVEKYAKKYNLPVIYTEVIPTQRGHYKTNYKLLTDQPRDTDKGDITRMHVEALEETIYRDPSYWLWTHRRWKHDSRPEERSLYEKTAN